MKKTLLSLIACLLAVLSANAAITEQAGWFESAYMKWAPVAGATDYNVYVKPAGGTYSMIDKELVRKYPDYFRADVVGLKAGTYQMKVVPVTDGTENASAAMESDAISVVAHDRSGFAHVGMTGGIGAYKNDGTLKDNAKVIYVTANNAKTVSTTVKVGSKASNTQLCEGLQTIIDAYQKGYETTPLDIRIIGTIKKENLDHMSSSAEGLQVKGKNAYSDMPITIEGIGDDAAISGFGILLRNSKNTEFRNFAIMLCMDDCLSLDTENSNIWIHNMDFFYGNTGGDADQAKGDGTVDIKAHSKNVTVSYCHFYDAGKCSLGGMSGEQTDAWHTYHHNWFDHSDSRHPRIRVQFFHIYNNYYDGNSKYGVGAAMGGTAFVENNYFRNCKYPMLSSKQGTDAEGDGTFSGENGGVIKAINNIIINPRKVQYYDGKQTDGKWDAVLVTSRDASVSAVAFSGNTPYNNEADLAARTTYIENKMEDPSTVVATVTGALGAGRMNHGDFKWRFNNSLQDENYGVVSELKSTLQSYKSTLVGFADGTAIANGGATETVNGGDGKDISDEENNKYVPTWAGGSGSTTISGKPALGSDDDYFWFNEANQDAVKALIADGTITGGDFKPAQVIAASDGTKYSDYTGSIRLAQNGTLTFYNANGMVSLAAYVSGNGSMSWQISTSNDGDKFTNVGGAITGSKGGHPNVIYSGDAVKYVRITNGASGNRDIQGIKMYEEGEAEADNRLASDLTMAVSEKTLNIGESFTISYTSSSTGAVTFSSATPSVLSVDANGKATAIAEGNVEVKVRQAGDDNYKVGERNVFFTVVDPRTESALALTSESSILIKEAQTSQIAITGAAGAVTYASSNTAVATVDAAGKITAVGMGNAIITVTDAGTETVKGGSQTITVTVTKDMTGKTVVTFDKPSSGKEPVSSDPTLVSFGGTTTFKDAAYGEYSYGTKLESATEIKIVCPSNGQITLVFDAASKRTYIDGESVTSDTNGEYTFAGEAGKTYTLKKRDSVNLYAVIFDFNTATTLVSADQQTTKKVIKFIDKNGNIIIGNHTAAGMQIK